MYALISPFSKTFDEIGLLYSIPDFLRGNIKIGQVVEIPFKDKIEIGIVINISDYHDEKYDESKIKSLISIHNSEIFLSKYRVELLQWIATYYYTPIHNSHNLFFPKNLVSKIKNGKIELDDSKEYKYEFNNNSIFSEKQEQAYVSINKSNNNKILLYGLTGSGKTEIYIKLISNMIKQNKQVLFLIPEIILTNQLSEKIIKAFGEDVIIINSTVTDATKTKYWKDINSGEAKIIIGTRSSLFYPYNNLGLIIIDEEHDNSYISDSSPRYNTLEVANKITELNGNKLVLGSGTPSITSMYKGIKGEYEIVTLLEKYKKEPN